uniref:Deoxyribonuclease V n=1 Tax=uncultured prokaryote TaxID=198431 RepID=H5SEK4_9ZZZZ|nr:deoxyribonuclease V [uncultured prokaryote]
MQIKKIHPWQVSLREALALQERLKHKLTISGEITSFRYVLGCDVAYGRGGIVVAAAVLMDMEKNIILEYKTATGITSFPYIPGLLAFREGPFILRALKRIRGPVDFIVFDGHGIAHPSRMGIASHIGLHIDVPSIGVAKSILIGHADEPGRKKGEFSFIYLEEERVGVCLRTRDGVKPVYVSPGNRIGIIEAKDAILKISKHFRIPEPLRHAHMIAGMRLRALVV